MTEEQKLITVTGWVVPVGGRAGIRVAVVPDMGQGAGQDAGQGFFVLHKGAGVDLLGHISAGVEVSGLETPGPAEDEAGGRCLLVRRYRVLDEDWDEDVRP